MPNSAPISADEPAGIRREHGSARLLQALVTLIGAGAVVVGLSIYNRDAQALRADRMRLEYWADRLRESRAHHDLAPIDLPLPAGQSPEISDAYEYTRFFDQQAANHGRAAVVYRREPLRLLFQRDGRHLLTFDGREFSVNWVAESEFAERLRKMKE